MLDATDLPPLTFEQKQALRECRYVTVWGGGIYVLALTPDRELASAVGGSVTPFQPDKTEHPELWEYEVTLSHPDAIPVARELMAARAA